MFKRILTLAILLTYQIGSTQSLTDALRYSSFVPGGTARVIGAGSSFGAMGGDFGVIGINPAGIADFRTSEMMFNLSFNGGDTKSSLGTNAFQKTTHQHEPRIENIGIVFSVGNPSGKLVTNNLAIGLTQYNNFNQDFGYEGYSNGSITERFAQLANGRQPEFFDPFEAQLAWEAGAIFDFNDDLTYETDLDTIQDVFKSQSVSRSGRINELSIAWAGKFDNNLNVGIGIGIPFVSFEEDKIYREEDLDNRFQYFEELRFSERLATSGTGINFKLGLTYIHENALRFGLSYQSPTYYSLDDNYYNELYYVFSDSNGSNPNESGSPDGRFDYRLTTPSKVTASIGTLIKTDQIKGFVNFDAQYINYTNNKFDFTVGNNDPSEAEFEREVNTEIENQLSSSWNFNFGGEFAFENFRLRGGLGLLGSPYEIDDFSDFSKIYSIGAGYRADRIYFDLAFQFRKYEEGYIPYQVIETNRLQLVTNEVNLNKLSITVGFKI